MVLNFDDLPILNQLKQGKVIYLFWKPNNMCTEIQNKIWNSHALRARRPVFVKLVPFQLGRCGHTFEGVTPSYATDSGSSILGLSNEVSYVS